MGKSAAQTAQQTEEKQGTNQMNYKYEELVIEGPGSLEDLTSAELVDMHNQMTPEAPVKKFSDRTTGIKRVWTKLEEMGANGPFAEKKAKAKKEKAPKAAKPEPDGAKAEKEAAKLAKAEEKEAAKLAKAEEKEAEKAAKLEAKEAAKLAKAEAKAAKTPKTPKPVVVRVRDLVIEMVKSEEGATVEALAEATGWNERYTSRWLATQKVPSEVVTINEKPVKVFRLAKEKMPKAGSQWKVVKAGRVRTVEFVSAREDGTGYVTKNVENGREIRVRFISALLPVE